MPTPALRTVFAATCLIVSCGADWRQFRGNHADGFNDDANPPSTLDHVDWAEELPGRGLSGPIVIGDRVVITSSSGFHQDRLHVLCFRAEDGSKLWERQFWATGRTMCHPKMCVATPTPASDGHRIFAYYSSNDVVCLNLDGQLLWFRSLSGDYPHASNSLGLASSPIVVDETLVVQIECDADSFALGLDSVTGRNRWKIERPRRANWTSPSILGSRSQDVPLLMLQSSAGLSAVDPASGQVSWAYDEGASTIPSSVVSADMVFVPSHGLTALRPAAESASPEIAWQESRLAPATPSPLVYQNRVFILNSAGVLAAAEAESGKLLWRLRLKGPFMSSPVAGNGHLYFFNEEGYAQVVRVLHNRGEIVSEREFQEPILCTPAIAGDGLYVRSDQHLWRIAP